MLFWWQLKSWDEAIWKAVLGRDATIQVTALRMGRDYLGDSFKAGMRLFGWQF
jgi:hypothetical protein